MMKRWLYVLIVVVILVIAAVLWLMRTPEDGYVARAPAGGPPSAELLERGRVLSRLANCEACHTVRGGEPFAGGRAIPTAFGTFYSPNITMDVDTGIGRWNERDFWRALHLGLSRDGALLYPAFPYPNFTALTQDDAHALWEYLKTVTPVSRRSTPHTLRFPYKYRPLMSVWRAIYFRPGVFQPDANQSAAWNRGAYLTEAVAHCNLCHLARNSLGAPQSPDESRGGSVLGWYAPALNKSSEAGVQNWTTEDIVDLLHSGRTRSAATLGPMAEVVFESLQHAPRADIEAIATYLKAQPEPASAATPPANTLPPAERTAPITERGGALYKDKCATCHGDAGEGRPPAALALAGNRAVTLNPAVNTIRVVLYGGYTPGTAGNPQPFGMPPFEQDLSDEQIADVLSFIRTSWGNSGTFVGPDAVFRQRTGPLW